MHDEILTPSQRDLLPLVHAFSNEFILVGGTAIALYIGHRESIDFDLFTRKEFKNIAIRRKIDKHFKIDRIVTQEQGQYTILVRGVRFTFYQYLYALPSTKGFKDVIGLPSLLTLAAMKAFALGQRAKWKDYVDLYFILRDHYSVQQINKKGKELFGNEYNERIFQTSLCYFDDVSYIEPVTYKPGFAMDDDVVKKALERYSLEWK